MYIVRKPSNVIAKQQEEDESIEELDHLSSLSHCLLAKVEVRILHFGRHLALVLIASKTKIDGRLMLVYIYNMFVVLNYIYIIIFIKYP